MVNNSTFTISTKGTNISHLKPLNDIRFCVLNNANVVTHEVRRDGQNIVKRERTGKVTMTCDLSNIQPRNVIYENKI
jgi:hypothetical protein